MCTYLKGRFRSLEAAEETYNLTLSDALTELTVGHPKQRRNNNAVQLQQQSATNPQQNPPVVACQCSLLSIKLSQILQDLPSKTGENCRCLFPCACIESWYRHKPRKLCFTISKSNEVTAVSRKD